MYSEPAACVCVQICDYLDHLVVGQEQAKKVLAGEQGDVFRACGMCVCVCVCVQIYEYLDCFVVG